MHIGRHNSEQKYYFMRGQLLESVKEEKDFFGNMVVQRHGSFTAML